MATKKRSKSKSRRAKQAAPAAGPRMRLSTAVRSVLNMAAVAVMSGSVLLFLLAARRFL
jgi:hypothetical protein